MNKRKIVIIAVGASLAFVIIFLSIYFLAVYLPEKRERKERERLVQEYYENKLSLYRDENEAYADYEVDVAFLGDSLTDGYDLYAYYPQYVTANRGIGGETTYGLESRMQVSVYDLKPKVAVMLIGGNNLDTMLDNYEKLLIGLRDNLPNTKVVLLSLTAMGQSWAHKNQRATYNNITIKKLADKYGFEYVDLYTPLFDETTGEIYSSYTTDGAHLTQKGYSVFTDTLTPMLDSLLAQTKG